MALYDTRFGLPQAVVDYLNQGLPDIYQSITQPSITPINFDEPTSSNDLDKTVAPIIQATRGGGGGGGGDSYSVYNPDPNMTRTQKDYVNPFPYNPMDDFGTSNYGYIEQPRKGIPGLFDQYIKGSIPAQLIGKGFNFLKDKLPVNKTGILQNELLGAGFMLDNTGKIVANDYNTPEGIMAGYNPVSGGLLNMLTGGKKGEPTTYGLDKAFDKRRETISNTLRNKYGMTDEEIEDAIAGEYTGDIETDLIGRLDLFNKSQNLFNKRKKAADVIFDRKLEERREKKQAEIDKLNRQKIEAKKAGDAKKARELQIAAAAKVQEISKKQAREQQKAIERENTRDSAPGRGDRGNPGGSSGAMTDNNAGTFCFDPNTLVQMADGSEKKIKEIQLGDQTKGGEVTGVFQFKASDEIHDYKGVTVAGSHYVKENGRFIMVQDSPLSVKIDKIPVVYSLDTTGRRIFIKDIEFADYNGDGVAKNFLTNAGVDLTGFDTEVLRQVENRLI
jgi:hypothetical protein